MIEYRLTEILKGRLVDTHTQKDGQIDGHSDTGEQDVGKINGSLGWM
jgi:hypothetical protein